MEIAEYAEDRINAIPTEQLLKILYHPIYPLVVIIIIPPVASPNIAGIPPVRTVISLIAFYGILKGPIAFTPSITY